MLKKLFNPSGRVNRLQNIGYELLSLIIMLVVGTVLSSIILGLLYLIGSYDEVLASGATTITPQSGVEFIILIPIIALIISSIIIKIKRLHDINLSGWWLPIFMLLVIPYIALYFWQGTEGKNRFDEDNDKTTDNSDTSLVKAVYNHSKDIAAEIKPTVSEYKQKHATSKIEAENKDINLVDEDTMYEQVMLEIEEDNKVKATWAKALAQSDGDKDRAEALYIQFRVKEIQKLQTIKYPEQKNNKIPISNENDNYNMTNRVKEIEIALNGTNKNVTANKDISTPTSDVFFQTVLNIFKMVAALTLPFIFVIGIIFLIATTVAR